MRKADKRSTRDYRLDASRFCSFAVLPSVFCSFFFAVDFSSKSEIVRNLMLKLSQLPILELSLTQTSSKFQEKRKLLTGLAVSSVQRMTRKKYKQTATTKTKTKYGLSNIWLGFWPDNTFFCKSIV